MTLLHAWVLFPLVLAALSLGCGLLLEQLSGFRLPGALLLPAGFAATIVAADLVTSISAIARFALAFVVALAVAGYALGLPDPRRPGRWTLASVLLVFAVYAAPVVLSGRATFAGYIKLDDTSTWLAIGDHVLEHGRAIHLPPSTYEHTLVSYVGQTGYPVGSVLPLGIGAKLSGLDPIWAFQPFLAFQGALLALGLYGLLGGLVRSSRARALVVVVAAQPSLLYGYSLWGAIKELVTVPLIALLLTLFLVTVRREVAPRALLLPAVASAALLGVLNVGGGVWLGLSLVPALALALRLPLRSAALRAGVFTAAVVVLALPTIVTASDFFNTAQHSLTDASGQRLGNLLHPLSVLQIAGIWPVGDFRVRPNDLLPTYVLIGVLLAASATGLALAAKRRPILPAYVGVNLAGCAVLVSFGSPWVDAKALATAAPALLLAALTGAVLIFQRGRRVEAVLVAAAIAFGVGWSNVYAWHSVWLAPRDQLAELETIGNRFAGQGPALINEYQPYGGRHLLRRLDAESSGELRRRLLPLRGGGLVNKGGYADIDGFFLSSVLVYKTLVLPRSPIESRPPSVYALTWSGRYYDVWQRPDSYFRILEHLSLGRTRTVVAVPPCAEIMRLAALAGRVGGSLVFVPRRPPVTIALAPISRPRRWGPRGDDPVARSAGTLSFSVFTRPGSYGVWLAGSFAGRMEVLVDGRRVGATRHRLEHPGQFVPFGNVRLSSGLHKIALRYSGPDWHPGSAAAFGLLSRVVLSKTTESVAISTIAPSHARDLCGRSLDWVEAVAD